MFISKAWDIKRFCEKTNEARRILGKPRFRSCLRSQASLGKSPKKFQNLLHFLREHVKINHELYRDTVSYGKGVKFRVWKYQPYKRGTSQIKGANFALFITQKGVKISASGQTCGQVRKMGLFNPRSREEQARYVYCENARFQEI